MRVQIEQTNCIAAAFDLHLAGLQTRRNRCRGCEADLDIPVGGRPEAHVLLPERRRPSFDHRNRLIGIIRVAEQTPGIREKSVRNSPERSHSLLVVPRHRVDGHLRGDLTECVAAALPPDHRLIVGTLYVEDAFGRQTIELDVPELG